MAVYVKTENASELLGKLKKAIDEDKIKTWKYDGWLRPVTTEKYLVFGIICPKNESMSTLTYAVYHGRFIEMMLNNFDSDFDLIYASAQKTQYDIY